MRESKKEFRGEVKEVPNCDISQFKEEFKEVLIYFDNCDNILPDVALIPVIGEFVRKIREQGSQFHTCVQKSITQSYSLESHADDVIKFLEAEDLNLDSNGFRVIFENTRQNTEITKEIKEKYDSIKNELVKIEGGFYAAEENIKNELQSLKDKREDLEEASNTLLVVLVSILGFVPLSLLLYRKESFFKFRLDDDFYDFDFFIGVGIAIATITISMATNLEFISNPKAKIRKINGKISRLESDKESIEASKKKFRELKNICDKMLPIVKQMGYFNIYWEMQYRGLKELSTKFDDISDENRKLLVETAKSGWERVKKSTNNYIKTVRNVVAEVHKSSNTINEKVNENNDVKNENA